MSDNTQADIIVTAQAGMTSIENKYATLARDSGSITPTTLTAMEGIHRNVAFRANVVTTDVITKLQSAQSSNSSLANYHPSASSLNNLGNSLAFRNDALLANNSRFGVIFNQTAGHIETSQALRLKTDFIANTSFADYGSGISSMRDTLDQGMTSSFGDLNASAKAMSATKGVFDPSDMKTYGTYEGLYNNMTKNKLANYSGLNSNLQKYNVNPAMIGDPAYSEQVEASFASITDPSTLKTMADQFDLKPDSVVTAKPPTDFNPFAGTPGYTGSDASVLSTPGFLTPSTTTASGTTTLPPLTGDVPEFDSSTSTAFGSGAKPEVGVGGGGIESAKDFLAMNKVTGGTDLTGMKDGLQYSDIGQKLSGMGANFEDPDEAARMFESMGLPAPDGMELYDEPTSPAVSMGGLSINTMTGSGTGIAGLPALNDYFPDFEGNDAIVDLQTQLDTDFANASISTVSTLTSNANLLLSNAGVDFDALPASNLGHTMTFGTNLHRYGADDLNNPTNTTAFGAAVAPGEPRGGYAGIDGIDDFGKSVTDMVNTDLLSGYIGTGESLRKLANTSDKSGQAAIAALHEGKNKAVMQQHGIMPLNYGPNIGKV
jgi:hypothetical protein